MNGYEELPVLEQLAELRTHLAIMAQADRDARAAARENLELAVGTIEIAKRGMNAAHAAWRDVAEIMIEALGELDELDSGATAELRAQFREVIARLRAALNPVLN